MQQEMQQWINEEEKVSQTSRKHAGQKIINSIHKYGLILHGSGKY